jgi:hypothetical protein
MDNFQSYILELKLLKKPGNNRMIKIANALHAAEKHTHRISILVFFGDLFASRVFTATFSP